MQCTRYSIYSTVYYILYCTVHYIHCTVYSTVQYVTIQFVTVSKCTGAETSTPKPRHRNPDTETETSTPKPQHRNLGAETNSLCNFLLCAIQYSEEQDTTSTNVHAQQCSTVQ